MRKVTVKVKKEPRVVALVGTRSNPQSPQAPAAGQSVRRSPSCPVCQQRSATTEVSIGAMNVKVCSPCAEPIIEGMNLLGSAARLLARFL